MAQFLFRGAASGFVATIPMTIVMVLMHWLLPRERQQRLAPREVAEGVADQAGVEQNFPARISAPTKAAAHFGYGSVGGVLYQLLLGSNLLARLAFGMTFGFAVWAVSYFGYLPALGIRRSADADPPERNATMITAHLVWGAALGLLAAWRGRGNESAREQAREPAPLVPPKQQTK